MSRKFLAIGLLTLVSMTVSAQITVTDDMIQAGQNVTFTADNEYLLDGFVFVEDGAVLTIQPGTVIRGKAQPTTGDNASALIIARGGQIMANGTAQNPIIFTAESDDLSDPSDLSAGNRGLWGGLILLGRATTNRGVEGQIEGIPSDETRAAYGGTDDTDNSGTLRYVSIRHAGAELGPGDEINGLTLGAVGSGTTVEYIEVFANLDDGYEWFGGTVNSKYLVAAFCADDAFDYDEGWRGKNQFWFAVQSTDKAGRVGEHDGGTINETGTPFSTPEIYNATYIGPGVNNFPEGDGGETIIFRDNAGGTYGNSILTEYNGANDGSGVRVEDIEGEDSRARLEGGDLNLTNNIWWQFGNGKTLDSFVPQDFVRTHLAANGNRVVDPQLAGVSRTANGQLDPRPAASGRAGSGATAPADNFYTNVGFFGAFDPNADLWTNGWTALAQEGHTSSSMITVTDDTIQAGQTYNMTANNVYLLDGFVFVEDGATLNIQAGTVIKAKANATTGDNASALIIARGAQIFANGTAQNPIVFTAESDDINDQNDLSGNNRGLWGGVIVLGRATTNRGVEGQIEGIPSDETRAAYGGKDDTDNSGVLRYVSIRHAGAELGPGDEINGLTFGAVGSGTIVEHIEVFANLDDGYEWFGGTVNTKYLVAAFCADDAFDYDEGWRGNNQFWFAIQSTDKAGRVGEHDGGTINETGTPFSTPKIYNATYIGPGISNFPEGDGGEAVIFRDNAGGSYINSIISNYNGANDGAGMRVEDIEGEDSRARLDAGDLQVANNIWWQFGNGNTLEAIAPQEFLRTYLANNNNSIADPMFGGISRSNNGGLNPRPSASGPAATGAMAPTDPFFMNVAYRGAFDPSATLWTDGWTALWKNGYTAQVAPEVNTKLLYSWVSNSQQFESSVVVNNLGGSAAQVTMIATREDGTTEMAGPMTVPAAGFVNMTAADLFPTFGVGRGYTVTLESSSDAIAGRWVTNDITNLSPSQGVAVSIKEAGVNVGRAVSFGFLPGSNGFQSAPVVVNAGTQPVNVTVYYFDASGSLVDTDTISGLGPQTPVIPRFVDTTAGDVHAVAVADGGMVSGAVFVFNADGQTAIGAVTAVEGFQAPQ